jgi:hypothetical protein
MDISERGDRYIDGQVIRAGNNPILCSSIVGEANPCYLPVRLTLIYSVKGSSLH